MMFYFILPTLHLTRPLISTNTLCDHSQNNRTSQILLQSLELLDLVFFLEKQTPQDKTRFILFSLLTFRLQTIYTYVGMQVRLLFPISFLFLSSCFFVCSRPRLFLLSLIPLLQSHPHVDYLRFLLNSLQLVGISKCRELIRTVLLVHLFLSFLCSC